MYIGSWLKSVITSTELVFSNEGISDMMIWIWVLWTWQVVKVGYMYHGCNNIRFADCRESGSENSLPCSRPHPLYSICNDLKANVFTYREFSSTLHSWYGHLPQNEQCKLQKQCLAAKQYADHAIPLQRGKDVHMVWAWKSIGEKIWQRTSLSWMAIIVMDRESCRKTHVIQGEAVEDLGPCQINVPRIYHLLYHSLAIAQDNRTPWPQFVGVCKHVPAGPWQIVWEKKYAWPLFFPLWKCSSGI